MSVFLKFKPLETTADFDFIDPDTGFQYREESRAALISRINAYRAQNDLPELDALPAVLENYWCSKPNNKGRCEPNNKLHRSLWTTIRGGISLLVNLWYEKTATQEVAESRAKQCRSCPNNEFPDKNAFVAWSDAVAVASVGDKKTSYHAELGNCKVCSCVLKAKVFYDGSASFTAEENLEFRKVNCWQLRLAKE